MAAMKGKLDGTSLRVPVPTGSITDFVANLKKPATTDEINAAFSAAANGSLKGVLEYCTAPIVSSDIVGNPHSCVFDAELTMSMGTLVKVFGWYDNEWGYSNRLVDLTRHIGKSVAK
jgi:glyceraldehyde 3-phosphate dehydrogenase